jgi:hypothetical protein
MDFDADVTACAYSAKLIDWERAATAIKSDHANPQAAALRYVFAVEDPTRLVTRGRFIRAQYAGTGFLMVRRAALLKLCAADPQRKYRYVDYQTDPLADSPHRVARFECMIDPATEGEVFREIFTGVDPDLAAEICPASPDSKLTHLGGVPFVGDFSTQFNAPSATRGLPPPVAA